MNEETINLVRHIIEARIDTYNEIDTNFFSHWVQMRDIFEYALANNIEALKTYDVFRTDEEIEEDFLRDYIEDCEDEE